MSNEISVLQTFFSGKARRVSAAVHIPYRGLVISLAIDDEHEQLHQTIVFRTSAPEDKEQLFTADGANIDTIMQACKAIDDIVGTGVSIDRIAGFDD